MRRLRKATRSFTPAAMFQLSEDGYGSAFEILVACIISIRTFEEVTLPASRRLFEKARTPKTISARGLAQGDSAHVQGSTLHERQYRLRDQEKNESNASGEKDRIQPHRSLHCLQAPESWREGNFQERNCLANRPTSHPPRR
jgi:hypothetical protein